MVFVDFALTDLMAYGLEAGGTVRCAGDLKYWMYWEEPAEGPFVQSPEVKMAACAVW